MKVSSGEQDIACIIITMKVGMGYYIADEEGEKIRRVTHLFYWCIHEIKG